ncbi:MAG TPA: hypothetical protein PKK10_02420 [Woeseiaceae bacterium]|nr:hypothetical protein [Woeseiaceae bacterium]
MRLLFTLTLLAATGCVVNAADNITTSINDDFQLVAGQSARLSNENIQIEFLEVASDSRCGKGEACISEGDAIVRISLRLNSSSEAVELHTASKEPHSVNFSDYNIRLVRLDPAAISGRAISPADYIATFNVSLGAVYNDAIN